MYSRIKRTAVAVAVATALALPGAAMAQTAKEQELEARIAELEKLVREMQAVYGSSERRALRVFHWPRSTHRQMSVADPQIALRLRLRERVAPW